MAGARFRWRCRTILLSKKLARFRADYRPLDEIGGPMWATLTAVGA